MRALGATIGIAAAAIVAFALAALIHLGTPLGRDAARDAFVAYLGSRVRGDVSVERFTELSFARVEMTDFRVDAPNGETVIATARMGGNIVWSAPFSRGVLELRPCVFDRSRVRLTRGPNGQINLVHAMEIPDDRWTPIPIEMNQIHLIENVIMVDLPGKPSLTMRGVHGLANLHVGHRFEWQLADNRGTTHLGPLQGGFRWMSGRVRSDHASPLRAELLMDLEIAEPGVGLEYRVPALAGESGDPHFGVELGRDLHVSDARDDCAEGDLEECRTRAERRRAEREQRRH
ncbi:MAG: hypothetical protein AB7S26_27450 [Sandaracinaceae bacterium]